jgi:putative FmdB family regulatory protein
MPLYEYECDANGHRFEVIQKHSDPLIDKCPVCGAAVHKLQSAPAVHFKGTGWYVTDYAKKDGEKTAKTDGGSSDAGKDKADASKDKTDIAPKTEKSEKASTADTPAKPTNPTPK